MFGLTDRSAIRNDADELASRRRQWFVLHVKPRTEKKVTLFLHHYGCFYHLPAYIKVTKVQRRKVKRKLPLFPGYVFTRLSADERLKMLQTNLLVRPIPVLRPREMIHQLRQIARVLKGQPDIHPVQHLFKAGDYVRIKWGPFRGTEGYVRREGAHATLCLNVEALGSSAELAISPADIEKID